MSHAPRYGRVVDAASGIRAPAPMTLLGALLLGALVMVALSLLAGCGNPAPTTLGTAAASSGATPDSSTATATASPTPQAAATRPPTKPAPASAAELPAGSVELPWPATSSTEAAALQKSVDAGSEPWLLDPTEVAMSYASAAHGWTQATARARPGGTTIEVQQSGSTVVLSLNQPVRTGAGGIWVVTGENPVR